MLPDIFYAGSSGRTTGPSRLKDEWHGLLNCFIRQCSECGLFPWIKRTHSLNQEEHGLFSWSKRPLSLNQEEHVFFVILSCPLGDAATL